MFTAEEVQDRIRARPFQPIRLIASEGLRYDIHHPDLVLVGLRDVTIGHPSKKSPAIYDRLIQVALVHLVGIEELTPEEEPAASPPDGTSAA